MPALGSTFASLNQPGPASEAPAPAPPVGGTLSNDHALEAAKTHPLQAARIAKEISMQRLKSLGHQFARARNVVQP